MTENLRKFLETVSANEELAKKASTASKEELIAMAKELGVELTEADFKQESAELSDDELDAVAGGGSTRCYCAVGGGGKKGEDDQVCACVVAGFGFGTVRGKKLDRCYCELAGYGFDCGVDAY